MIEIITLNVSSLNTPIKRQRLSKWIENNTCLYTVYKIPHFKDRDRLKGKRYTPIHCWLECKNYTATLETLWQFLTKLNILLPYNPTQKLCSSVFTQRSWKLTSLKKKKPCIWMFKVVLFIIAQAWKQWRCPWKGE